MKKLLLILICSQLFFSCKKKDDMPGSCESLQAGVLNDDIAKTGAVISGLIDQLRSKVYTEANLTALVKKISSQCNVTSTILCFDCIKTLPSQSEIRIEINSGATVVARIIDITYSATNTMTFGNMHN